MLDELTIYCGEREKLQVDLETITKAVENLEDKIDLDKIYLANLKKKQRLVSTELATKERQIRTLIKTK